MSPQQLPSDPLLTRLGLSTDLGVTFAGLFQLHRLQDVVNRKLSVEQLLRLVEMVPAAEPRMQLSLLRTFQRVLHQLHPQQLETWKHQLETNPSLDLGKLLQTAMVRCCGVWK